jgi:hypothetical protein
MLEFQVMASDSVAPSAAAGWRDQFVRAFLERDLPQP